VLQGLGITIPFTAILAAMAFGYLLGSIPFGLLLTRAAGLGDVRKIGSGNIGATNVLRTGNKGLAAATLALDMLKGTLAVWLAARYGAEAGLFAGFGAFAGHLFPVWLWFKGGKGVATFLGVLLGLSWKLALLFAVVWIAMAFVFRFSSLSALTAALVTCIGLFLQSYWLIAWVTGLMTLAIFIKHRPNIERLIAGTESRIGTKE
jgi:acyl phosphate:glycerol-3-phosphate acyltransferase